MVAYILENYGQPIFDTTKTIITLNAAGQSVNHYGNVVSITTSYGLTNDGSSPPSVNPQPEIPSQVAVLITFVMEQAVRST